MSGEDGDGEDATVGTRYRFVPYARRGFQPSDRFSSGKPDASTQPTLGIDITPKARKRAEQGGGWTEDPEDRSVTLSVYGPGDVQGLDTDQLARVEPEPDTAEFPANYFPFVEFDRPDLPWLFSPERADDAGRTRPWLSLVVVTDDDTVDVTVGGNRPCPVLTFGSGADLASELPDLTESWAWAHVQAQGSPEGKSQGAWEQWLPDELQRTSNLTVSRVLSPRNLQPRTDYVAALVPTFAAGRLAGLGRDPYDSGRSGDGDSASEGEGQGGDSGPPSASLAWSLEDLPSLPFELPLYHYWRFTAGEEGTFEHLVRKLGPVELGPDVGRKSVDVRDPGPPSLAAAGADPTADVGGALYSVPAKRAMEPYGKQERLRTLLNKPETLGETGGEDAKFPIVGPPLYGQWHAGLSGIPDPARVGPADYDPRWFRQLNVNLRNRVAASVGANVVREHQNQLMDAAWEVVGEVREANEFTRAHQGVEAIGDAIESWRGAFDGGARGVEPPALSPWAVRRELERLERLGGIDPDVEGGVVDPTVVGGGAVDPAGGGVVDPVGGDPTGGDVLGGDGLPSGGESGLDGLDLGGGTTQPLGTGVAGLGRRTRLRSSGLSRAYLDADRMERPLDTTGAPTTDGGAAAAPSPDDGTTKAAVYQQYLETFMAQPETSLQYQRLVRLDGPLGRKAEVDRTDYRQSLRRAARRAAAEVGTVSDGLLGGTPGELPAGAKREPEHEDDGDRTGPSDTGGFVGPPDLGGLLGDGPSSSSSDATTPAAAADADQPPVGVADAERLRLTATEGLPRTRAIESRVASRAALDARVGGSDLERGASEAADTADEPDDLPAVAALVESVVHHCDATDERVRRARRALGSDDPAGAAVLGAYETAQPIAYALDPLDRALSKAIADPSVTVPEGLTATSVDETVQSLWTAYADLLAALTEAHGAALAAERERGDGPAAGDADEQSGDAPAAAPEEPLATATARVDDIRDLLADLPGARAPGASTVSLPDTLAPRPASAVMSALDARRASTYGTDLTAIDGQLAARAGEGRYRRALLSRRLSFMSGEFVRSDDPVERVMVAPEFPTPMWRPLKDLDEEYLLPGADGVPQDSVGLVVQNREFIESYMVGLNHEMGRELLWRRYPTDRRGTYFRRFWNRGQGPAWSPESGFRVNEDVPSKDIEKLHEWDTNKLRCNAPGAQELDKVVLLVRGKLFKRYPNTVVYAARAKATERDGRMTVEPMTPERFVEAANPDPDDVKFPTFRGEVGSDMTFLGFDLTHDDVYADQAEIREVVEQGEVPPEGQNLGWYFVFEERPGETRFGFDAGEPEYAGTRPVGVVDDGGAPRYPREETSDGSRGARTPVEDEPVGWDGLSWYHLVDDPDAVDDASYVSVADSRPGDGDWAVEGNVGDVATYLEAPFDASDEATWGKNSAHMARIAFQKPVRVSFHAHELLPDGAPSPSDADYCE